MTSIPNAKLKEFLIEDGLVTGEQFEGVVKDAGETGKNLTELLLSRNLISQNYLEELLSRYLKVPLIKLDTAKIDQNALALLPEEIARQRRVILFKKNADGSVDAAMEDPSNLVDIDYLTRYLNAKVNPYLASAGELAKGFSLYARETAENFKKIIEENVTASLQVGTKSAEEVAREVPIVAIVDNLISYAVSLRASDIHLEIFDEFLLIRYRIDGVLHEILKTPKQVHPAITARIKLLGGLKLDEHSKPQDGRFRYEAGGDVIDIRVSVLPTYYGEKIVMRLLRTTDRALSFTELGLSEETAKLLNENIKKSYGMVLICGPTGSGKTTTLYAVLNVLNRPTVNIVTVEDPIEYDIELVNQTQINPLAGITFANGLRAILRQDPNVIMVGEIRDSETADIATQAALTGHLVLSSLHTNDAPTAIPRFIDMGVPPFLVAAVLNCIMAQRLVRKIHLDCIESYEPDAATIEVIKEQFKALGIPPEQVDLPNRFYRGKGCAVDNFTGYEGRIGIYELLNITEAIRKIIIDPNFSLDKLKQAARVEGMTTMFEDGLRKVGQGITTIDEVLRVIRE
ncbi:MAG: type II/IV secretion system protein [Candidatus Colwellbacteria bacterium]|nr:type II/IV secretion system protein [Candidatus Colwellbacteria bacterium]